MTSTIASQNQRKTFKNRLRKPRFPLTLLRLLPRVDVADAAHGLDALDLGRLVAEPLAQVADVHVYAAVEERKLAPQRRAHQLLALHYAPRRLKQEDEYLVLDVRQLDRLPRAPDVTRARVNLNV